MRSASEERESAPEEQTQWAYEYSTWMGGGVASEPLSLLYRPADQLLYPFGSWFRFRKCVGQLFSQLIVQPPEFLETLLAKGTRRQVVLKRLPHVPLENARKVVFNTFVLSHDGLFIPH